MREWRHHDIVKTMKNLLPLFLIQRFYLQIDFWMQGYTISILDMLKFGIKTHTHHRVMRHYHTLNWEWLTDYKGEISENVISITRQIYGWLQVVRTRVGIGSTFRTQTDQNSTIWTQPEPESDSYPDYEQSRLHCYIFLLNTCYSTVWQDEIGDI